MKSQPTLLLLSTAFILFFSLSIHAEPPNLSLIKSKLINYHDSGQYEQELAKKIQTAQKYIVQEAMLNKYINPHQKLALVLDIDETSITNYNTMAQRDFTGDRTLIHQQILAANSPAIKPMLSLYQEALKQGIYVFFITGRGESERKATEDNLIKAGYSGWTGLYFRPPQYTLPSIMPFKTKTRASISEMGYKIIASIGDQYSDIHGGYTQKGFKLPNPFYYLP